MLLLGLIGIVGLALLAYSFKLSLVFLTVLIASPLMRVFWSKLLLSLQLVRQKSRVVITFWGSITLFLVSQLSLITFIYYDETISFIRYLEIVFPTFALIGFIAFLVWLSILVFLPLKIGFPRWTVLLVAPLGLAILVVPFWQMGFSERFALGIGPFDPFEVSYRGEIVLREKIIEVDEEYKIQPRLSYLSISVDDEWINKTPGVSIRPLHLFEGRESVDVLTGLLVTIRREIEADITRLGLLRRKLELPVGNLQVRIKNLIQTSPNEEADSTVGIAVFPLRSISIVTSGKLEVRLLKNSYLGSYPEGKLVKLPDRDQFVLDFSGKHPHLELYYLVGLRFGLVRTVLSDSSISDLALTIIAFIFWPVILLVLGATQRTLSDSLLRAIQRKPQRRRAGF